MGAAHHLALIARHSRVDPGLVQPISIPLRLTAGTLARFAGRWAELTGQIRADPESRAEVGWVCEMWACAIAAAETGVRFAIDPITQHTPEPLQGRPLVHYSYDAEAEGWSWSKRGYRPWEPVAPPPADAPGTARLLRRMMGEAAAELGGTHWPAPDPPSPVAPLPDRRCPGGVCRHGHGDECKAVITGHWRFCEKTDPDHPDYDPQFLAIVAPAGAASSPPPPAGPDPVSVAVDLCELRASCQCNATLKCTLGGAPGVVTRDQCRACAAAELARTD